jgi:hypothetical protein
MICPAFRAIGYPDDGVSLAGDLEFGDDVVLDL